MVSVRPKKYSGRPVKRVCTVHCGSFTMQCMVASSNPCKLSLRADRAHACVGDSHISNGIDVACPTTQNVLANASLHELHWDSWPSSSTGTSSFCCNHQYSVTAITASAGTIAERYAYSANCQPTILDASASVLSNSAINNRYTYTGREWDATLGLYHFRARWMSPSAGRFLGRDPIGYFDGMGLYSAYFAASGFDPFGLYEQPDTDLANCKIWSTNTRKKIDDLFPIKRIAPWATIRGSLFWEITFRNRLCEKKCDCERSATYESNEIDVNVNGRFSLTLGIDEEFSGKGPLKKLKFKAWGNIRGDLDIMGRGSGQLYKDGCSGKEGGQVCVGVEVRTAVRGGVEAKVSYDNWEWDLAAAELIFQCQNIRLRKCWGTESDIENPNFGDVKGISCNLLIRFCAYGYCYNEQLW